MHTHQKIALLIVFFASTGCLEGEPTRLLLDTELIQSLKEGEVKKISATELLPSNVGFVCSLFPFTDLELHAENVEVAKMLSQLTIFPLNHDGKAYFAYFNHQK